MHRLFVCLACLLLTSVSSAYAQEDPAVLAERVTQAFLETKGELAALKTFDPDLGLPTGLTREQAESMTGEMWLIYKAAMTQLASEQTKALGELPPTLAELIENAEDGRPSINSRSMPLREFDMPFNLIRRDGAGVPENGRALFICTHGGGGNDRVPGAHAWGVNTNEWLVQTQFAIRLYEPDGLYFVPRMADDRLGRWRHAHHQDQFELAIRHAILYWDVDPNRVYKLGISQGGFGSAILGMFMPDLFAGINPMAGGVGLSNPPENLRNVATFHSVGERDTMFNRAGNAIATHERLEKLREQDPEGYVNQIDVQPGRGHGINYRPGAPWIAKHSRNPHPDTVVWTSQLESGRRRGWAYWLELDGDDLKGSIALTAKADRATNTITLTAHQRTTETPEGDPVLLGEQVADPKPLKGATVSVLLNDTLVDLDKPVTITCNGKEVFSGKVQRDANTLLQTLVRRGDWNYAFPARVSIELK